MKAFYNSTAMIATGCLLLLAAISNSGNAAPVGYSPDADANTPGPYQRTESQKLLVDPAEQPAVGQRGGLTVYPDLASFETGVGDDLPLETFEGGHVSIGQGAECDEPVNGSSDDECFAPGDVIAGFSVTSSSGDGVVLLGQEGEAGQEDGTMIGAQRFSDITLVSFDADDVTAIALDVLPGLDGGLDVTVRAYDTTSGLIGAFTVTAEARNVSEFAGFSSPAPVSHIEIQTSNDGGELFHNLRFGANQGSIFRDRFESD